MSSAAARNDCCVVCYCQDVKQINASNVLMGGIGVPGPGSGMMRNLHPEKRLRLSLIPAAQTKGNQPGQRTNTHFVCPHHRHRPPTLKPVQPAFYCRFWKTGVGLGGGGGGGEGVVSVQLGHCQCCLTTCLKKGRN